MLSASNAAFIPCIMPSSSYCIIEHLNNDPFKIQIVNPS